MEIINTGKSVYDIENMILEVSKKFFKHEDGSPMEISTLRTGMYGWLSSTQATLAYNNILMKANLYDERFLNTAVMPTSIHNFAVDHNFNISLASPSRMEVAIAIKLSDIVKLKNSTNAPLTIAADTTFSAGGVNFKTMYPISVDYNISPDSVANSSIVASYNIANGKSFDISYDVDTIHLQTQVLSDQGVVILSGIEFFQVDKNINEFIYAGDDLFENKRFSLTFEGQLASFNVWYKETSYSDPVLMETYFGARNNSYSSIDEIKCNYEYIDDNTLDILFINKTTGFTPANGSTIIVETFTTLGTLGNIEYSSDMTTEFSDTRYLDVELFVKPVSVASGGVNMPSTDEYKSKLMNYIQSKGEMISDADIESHFDSIKGEYVSGDNDFLIKKHRDDIDKREYSVHVLMRNDNNVVIPTNTVDLIIPKDNIDDLNVEYFRKSDDGSVVTIPSGTYVIMKKTKITDVSGKIVIQHSDYFIMQHSNDNVFDENGSIRGHDSWLEYYKRKTDKYNVYKLPNKIVINKSRFLRAIYYRPSTDQEYSTHLVNYKSVYGKSFLISKLSVTRNSMIDDSDSNLYNMSFSISTNVSETYINEVGVGSNKNQVGAIALIYSKDDDGNRTYHGFKNASLDSSVSVSAPYKYNVSISSINKSNTYSTMMLRLFPIDDSGTITNNSLVDVEVPNEVYVSILVSYDPNDPGDVINSYFDTTTENPLNYAKDVLNPDLYDTLDDESSPTLIGLSNIINVLEAETNEIVVLNKTLSTTSTSDIYSDGINYHIKKVPVIKYDYIENDTNFKFFIDSLNNYEDMFEDSLSFMRQNTSVNIKFYNTYGKSNRFSIYDTDISLKLFVTLRVVENDQLHVNIQNHVIQFINNINKSGATRFSFSNLTTSLENTFSDILSVRLGDINGMKVYDIYEDEASQYEVPEYLNVSYDETKKSFNINIEYFNLT